MSWALECETSTLQAPNCNCSSLRGVIKEKISSRAILLPSALFKGLSASLLQLPTLAACICLICFHIMNNLRRQCTQRGVKETLVETESSGKPTGEEMLVIMLSLTGNRWVPYLLQRDCILRCLKVTLSFKSVLFSLIWSAVKSCETRNREHGFQRKMKQCYCQTEIPRCWDKF